MKQTLTSSNIMIPAETRVCIFDFDMTLADGGPWIVECYQNILHQYGYLDVDDKIVRSTIGLTIEDSFALMTGLTDKDLCWKMRMEFKAICRPKIAEKTNFFPDGIDFLRRLKAAGIACAIVSTKETAVIRQTLEMNHLENLFDCVVGLTEVKEAKPSPEGILYVLHQLNLPEESVVYFGDNPVDGKAAQRAGVKYIGVAKGIHTPEQLAAFPNLAIVEDYRAISLP